MALESGETIGNFTVTRLIRFVKDMFEKDPPAIIGNTSIDNLTINQMLTIRDQIRVLLDPYFHEIGKSGEPGFLNSWVNFGGSAATAAYFRDALGFVHLRGTIKSGTINTNAFVLPAGYRPEVSEIFAMNTNTGLGRLDVLTDGSVKPVSGGTGDFSLSGATFKAKT